jgi:hypothetical protein
MGEVGTQLLGVVSVSTCGGGWNTCQTGLPDEQEDEHQEQEEQEQEEVDRET